MSCLEVEVVRALRERPDWSAGWVQAWACGRRSWEEWIWKRPDGIAAEQNARIQGALGNGPGKLAGHPDVALVVSGHVLYVECKVGSDTPAKQVAWIGAGLEEGVLAPGSFMVVHGLLDRTVRPTTRPVPRAAETAPAPPTIASSELQALIESADAAEPADRINYRNDIAAFGTEAIDAMLAWVAERRHSAFAVQVIERCGAVNRDAARSALSRAASLDPAIADMTNEAQRRLSPAPRAASPTATGRSGVLDSSYAVAAPGGQGCEWLTKQGRPCQNPANYWVDGKWSCSRDHRR